MVVPVASSTTCSHFVARRSTTLSFAIIIILVVECCRVACRVLAVSKMITTDDPCCRSDTIAIIQQRMARISNDIVVSLLISATYIIMLHLGELVNLSLNCRERLFELFVDFAHFKVLLFKIASCLLSLLQLVT